MISGSSAPSHGRSVRPAETRTHSSMSGLYRRWGSSIRSAGRMPSPAGPSDGTVGPLLRGSRVDDDELTDLGRERESRLQLETGIGDEHIGLVEPRDRADPDDAPLRMGGDDDEPPAGLDEGAVGVRLEQVRAGETGTRIHAVDPDEDEVHV